MESHVRIGSPIWQQVLANIGSDDEGEDGLPACSSTGLPSPTALGSNCSRPSSHLAGHGRARPDELASGSSSLAVAAAAASGPSSPPVWRAMLRSCAEDEPSSSSSLCRDLSRSFNLVAAARQERGSSRHVPAGASLRRMESIFSLVRCSDPTARGVSAACHPSEAPTIVISDSPHVESSLACGSATLEAPTQKLGGSPPRCDLEIAVREEACSSTLDAATLELGLPAHSSPSTMEAPTLEMGLPASFGGHMAESSHLLKRASVESTLEAATLEMGPAAATMPTPDIKRREETLGTMTPSPRHRQRSRSRQRIGTSDCTMIAQKPAPDAQVDNLLHPSTAGMPPSSLPPQRHRMEVGRSAGGLFSWDIALPKGLIRKRSSSGSLGSR